MVINIPDELSSHAAEANLLNYSIVSDDEPQNRLVLKLKVSEKNTIIPVRKANADMSSAISLDAICDSIKKDVKLLSPVKICLRRTDLDSLKSKSSRKFDQFSNSGDEDSVSPKKSRPSRTSRKKNEVDVNELCCYMTRSKLSTPTKRSLNECDESTQYDDVLTNKNNYSVSTPKRKFSKSVDDSATNLNESEKSVHTKRQIRTPARFQSDRTPSKSDKRIQNENKRTRPGSFAQFYYDTEDDDSPSKTSQVNKTPPRSVNKNLNESFRRSVLRTTVNLEHKEGNISTRRTRSNSIASCQDIDNKSSSRRRTLNKCATPTTPKTLRNRIKLIRDGVITPSMSSRSSSIIDNGMKLMTARNQLHVSYVPTSLPCREKEFLDIYKFLEGKLLDGYGGCMYVSGVPGTGKTATVTSAITTLQNQKELPKFSNVNLNGMRLTEPKQAYVEIYKQLSGKTVPWEQAQSLLEERFTRKKYSDPVIMVIDELDILCTKKQDVVYNLLDWPVKSKNQLIAIAIANTMDLPERLLMNRVTSRLGLTRLTFQPYTHKQLMEIITKRLTDTESFTSDAIQLVARKVASVSGDARRALDICRRAAEIAEETKNESVTVMHINEALTAMIMQPKVMEMKRCSRLEKLILQAIVAEVERTGVEETTFSDVFTMLISCCALDGFKMVSSTVAQHAVSRLSACRLILTDQKCSSIYQKIILNVSTHDVYFAIKNH